MAKKDTFLLVSLEEDNAKKLAQIITNQSCRQILDLLSAKNATESEIAKELNLPISTVHYNLQHLLKSKLVEANEYHYSQKGKEIMHYSIANKYIIIAPKGASESLKDKLMKLIPVTFFISAAAFVISIFSGTKSKVAMKSMPTIAEEADMLYAAAPSSVAPQTSLPIWIWFLIGAVFALFLFYIINLIYKKVNK
jgi:predicted transcriptional regulator